MKDEEEDEMVAGRRGPLAFRLLLTAGMSRFVGGV